MSARAASPAPTTVSEGARSRPAPLRILHVIESLGRGGAEQLLVNLLPALQRDGHRCEVAVLWEPYTLAPALEGQAIRVHRLGLGHRWNLWQTRRRLAAVVRGGGFDVVHAHLYFAAVAAGLLGRAAGPARRVVSLHSVDYDVYPTATPWLRLRKWLHGHVLRGAIDGHAAVSSAVAEHYRQRLGLRDVVVIPNALPLERLRRDPALDRRAVRRAHGVPEDAFLLAAPGRFVKEKGHPFLLQALRLLRERQITPHAMLVGDGPLRERVAAEVTALRLGDQVTFLAALPHEELMRLLQAADLFVMASTHEGFPLAPAEAMALEVPVLSTSVSGVRDLAEHGLSGWLVPPSDAPALADAIAGLMADGALRARLASGGLARVRAQLAADRVAGRWVAYYESLAPR